MPRALVIEDDEVTARDIVAELAAHGLTADWVDNGREGLDRALADGYDIITLDRMLPGMDGIDVISELRQRAVDTPVLMISALVRRRRPRARPPRGWRRLPDQAFRAR